MALLAVFVVASVVPASASESSGAVAWGKNNDGQLGNGTTTTEKEAVAVKVLTEATAVAAGELHSLALLKSGKVMAWGYNADGQLGNGTTTTEKEPVEVKGLTEVAALAAGADHSLALLKSGKVMAWGYNNDGQLGNGTTTTEKEPVEVKGLTEVVAIAAGADHSLAVLKSGKVKAWGDNNDGQLGNGTTTNAKEPVEVKGLTEATAVAGGEFHSLALLASGKVKAWGYNKYGQLGNGTTTTEKEPVEVKGLTEAVGIAAGHSHSLAVLKNGKVKAWGENNDGQLGNGTTTNAKEPVEVKGLSEASAVAGGEFHSLALLASGKVKSWGYNSEGQLGNGTTTTENEPVEVKGVSHMAGIAAGADFSLSFYAALPANTALPVVSGEAKDEKTLSATTGTWTGTPTITYVYQWESCNTAGEGCASISGATAATYVIAHEQVGHTIRVKVTASNVGGEVSASSVQTATVAASAPVDTALPVVSGEAKDEKTLSATTGTWTGSPTITYVYQWESCNTAGEGCASISGATAATYTVGHELVGHTIRVKVTAKNSAGEAAASSAQTATVVASAPVDTALPVVSGEAKDEKTLSATAGTWTGTPTITYGYQWERCNVAGGECDEVHGANGSSYTLSDGDVEKTIRVIVTATNVAGSASAVSEASAQVPRVAPSSSVLPTISGTLQEGQTLSTSSGSWTGAPAPSYTYQWQRCNSGGEACVPITGAAGSAYELGQADVGARIRARVTATNLASSVSVSSAATEAVAGTGAVAASNSSLPTISGTVRDGQVLSASSGVWSGTEPIAYAYQWQSCDEAGGECQEIAGATAPEYTLSATDEGTTLRVAVTATNSGGTTQAVSAASATVLTGAPSELEGPSISGSASVGAPVYAEPGVWAGSEVGIGYQWESCNEAGTECQYIPGATGAEFLPTEAQEGKALRVRVGASNEEGSATALSTPTGPVAAASVLFNTLAPSVSGEAQRGKTLTAHPGSWLGGEALSYSYQWQSCGRYGAGCEAIAGATASTYTVGAAVVERTLRVLVTGDEVEHSASEVSAPTQPVAGEGAPTVQVAPRIQGTGLVGYTLTATVAAWSGEGPVSETVQWERCTEAGQECNAITGATSRSYTAVEADAHSALRLLASATNAHGTSDAVSTPIIASADKPADVALPHVSGTYQAGRPQSAESGIWTGSAAIAFSYAWKRCNSAGEACETITGATSASYSPGEHDLEHTLVVVVTATSSSGTASASSAPTPAIPRVATSPENLQAPTIEGALTEGDTLTAKAGSWSGSEPISYSYQWRRCNGKGESCTEISGASGASYVLAKADVGLTLRVAVTATNSAGSVGATSVPTEVVGASGPPSNTEGPAIDGLAREGERLFSSNGIWSGSKPLTYFYRWQRCNSAGESCSTIEGATKPGYTPTSADVGKTLRVAVTTTNTHGEAGSISAATSVVVSATAAAAAPALEGIEHNDPSLLASATTAQIEGQPLAPAILDSGEQLTSQSTLASSTISKATAGEFALETSAGEVSFLPLHTSPDAAMLPTVVDGAAALYPETWHATDTVVRPSALGAITLVQLRSAEASTSLSWEVGLGPDQRLEQLPDGAVAIIEPLPGSTLEGAPGEPLETPGPSSSEPHTGGEGYNASAREEALNSSLVEEGKLAPLPTAPTSSTGEITPTEHELHPQSTSTIYERDKTAIEYAETHTAQTALSVIEAPTVLDAAGHSVPATLAVNGDRVTLTISPSKEVTYPVSAEVATAAPNDLISMARDPILYGISDPKPEVFTSLDPKLEKAPLHVHIARDVMPYYEKASQIRGWLEAVNTAKLEPYITLEVPRGEYCVTGQPCKQPEIATYKADVEALVKEVYELHAKEPATIPLVTRWGAWNEPDYDVEVEPHIFQFNPLAEDPGRAAVFWKIMQATVASACSQCRVAAGEFFQYNDAREHSYLSRYSKTILANKDYWTGRPAVWGLHDYKDVVHAFEHHKGAAKLEHFTNPDLEGFLKAINGSLGKAKIWLSEQGVELQNEGTATLLHDRSTATDSKRQREAANDFLDLAEGHSRIELADYYLYRGPSAKYMTESNKPHAFDSALVEGEGVTEPQHPREAYCVIVEGKRKGCPARASTKGHRATAASVETIAAGVEAVGLPTTYSFDYGTTTVYGHSTTITSLPEEAGEQTVSASVSSLEPCTLYHYQVTAENEANEGKPSTGGDQTFQTACIATQVSVASYSACALLSSAAIYCWGMDENGQLGNGMRELEASPGPVSGITNTVEVTGRYGNRCALLASESISCWGENEHGQLGDGTIEAKSTPVAVKGITNARAVSAGAQEACALLTTGGVDCWGENTFGELGDGTNTGPETCGTTEPVPCSRKPVAVSGISNATSVSVASGHVCAVLATGHIVCWGENFFGGLGDGTESTYSTTPVEITGITNATSVNAGFWVTCTLLATGGVDCWGAPDDGALGNGTESGEIQRTPVAVTGIANATEVSVGGFGGCARLSTGHLKCWGVNTYGQLGNGSTTTSSVAVEASGITSALTVSASESGDACALLTGGAVDCWGANGVGELGYSPIEPEEKRSTPVEVPGF
jgi:alpha-tubulin suppressor-like RCC1 family protein